MDPWSDDIKAAPAACHVLVTYRDKDSGEWIMAVEATPLSYPFTHWRMLDAPGTPSEGLTERYREALENVRFRLLAAKQSGVLNSERHKDLQDIETALAAPEKNA